MELDVNCTKTRKIIDFRENGYKDMIVLGKYNYNRTEGNLADHVHHDMIEICYYDKGSQWFCVNDKRYLVKGGDVFIHFPGELHGSGGYPEEKGLLYWLIICVPPELAFSQENDAGDLAYLCHNLILKSKRHFKGEIKLKQILEDVFNVYNNITEERIKRIRINLLIQNFLLLLLDSIDKDEKSFSGTDYSRINETLEFINENIYNNISIALLAKQTFLSESRFKTLFKRLTGFTPADYIRRKRIEKARSLMLENPSMPLSEIAFELNFSSPQHFSSVMKKYTGSAPSLLKAEKQR